MNKKKLGLILGVVLLVVLVLAFVLVYRANRPAYSGDDGSTGTTTAGAQSTDPSNPIGDKTVMVKIVYDDVSKTVEINTDADYLKGALEEKNLIVGSGEGEMFFITAVYGRIADSGKQEWWCITKGGEVWMTGCAATEIADGETYELTLKTGW